MKPSFLNGLAVLSLVAMSVGCASNGPVVRSQSPDVAGEAGVKQVSFDYMHAKMNHDQETSVNFQSMVPQTNNCPTCPPGQGGYYDQNCDQNCQADGMLCRCPWHPTHHHMYSYEQPKNLSYPTSQMGSLTRYPYYTFKGPNDFFLRK